MKIRTIGPHIVGATAFVVLGENPGSKFAKAEELGVETIDEQAFLARLGKDRR